MRRTFLKGLAASLVATTSLGVGGIATAQDKSPEEFYDGNVIQWIIPYPPGGGYDEYSRLLAPVMEKYTGARVDIVNMPGSGGMKGAVEIFNAPNDGTHIGIINGSAMVTNQLAGIEGANYKVGDYSYLGRVVADARVMVAAENSGIEDFEDLQNDGETAVVGATGLGGSTYVDAVISGEAFDIDQKVVHGFNSSGDVRSAMLRGDIDAMWGSIGSAMPGIENGDHHIILHDQKEKTGPMEGKTSIWDLGEEMGDDRTMSILEAWAALSAVGRPVAGPPGIPEDRLAFLRDAFKQAIEDPEFTEAAEKAGRAISYASGEEISKIAKQATELSPENEELFVKAIKGEI